MGNFSIGDYFKEKSIEYSFELLTSEKYFGIPKDKLYVTVYIDDEEAYNRWIEVGLDKDHIVKLEGNYWEIGEGPCGPDSEIFYDRGEKYENEEKNSLELFKKDIDQERYVEIWNNVFSEFNSEEGKDRKDYKELPSKNIDTGAGIERWACIFQGVDSNFETDLFLPIINHINELAKVDYSGQKEFKIIADHIRAITFAIADGATFDNTGRGYVLRRLLRRSERFGKNIGIETPFMYKLVDDVIKVMNKAYPYLKDRKEEVEKEIIDEEKLFLKTLSLGESKLKEFISIANDKTLSGEATFKLYDTYGFPFELTEEYLKEIGYTTSKEEFDKCMAKQKELARKSNINASKMAEQSKVLLDLKIDSTFVYNIYRVKSKVVAIIQKDERKESLDSEGYIVLNRTCFYAEQGGQVADTGMIIGTNFKARVLNVFKGPNGQNIHKVKLLAGKIKLNDPCEAVIDKERRKQIEQNHSSVHLLQYALQQIISDKITQAGSYVDQNKLRFDFTYPNKITDDKLIETENFINDLIKKNQIVSTEILPLDKAKQLGAMALFDEKYQDKVRVVKIGKSIELCGGTHTTNTSKIEKLAIISCESKGSNIYRIEATTGNDIERILYNIIKPYNDEVVKLLIKAKEILETARKENISLDFDVDLSNEKATSYKDILNYKKQLEYVQKEYKQLEKTYFEEKSKIELNNLDSYKEKEKVIGNTTTIIMKLYNKDNNLLKEIADNLINGKDNYIVLFANIKDNKISYIARSNSSIKAGDIVKYVATHTGGNGGGKPTFAEGGGKDIDQLDKVLNEVESLINE